ncbi:MAG: ElyC/SanA/YdcF family protein [Candidatus Sulfotelmatobacter sp.]
MNNFATSKLIFVGIAIVAALVFAANAGKILVKNDPQRSDVIVVLAGETDYRPALALQLLDQGYGRRLLLDVPSASEIYNFTQLQLAQQYISSLPESRSIDICPIEGLSTKAESHDVAKCLSHEPGTKVLIVTSDFHTRRALSIFRHEIGGRTFSVAAARDPAQFGTHWWRHREWAKTCLDEWLRVGWWNASDRWY